MTSAAWMTELAAFLFGLLLGSFLNVCIFRLPQHRSVSQPRSHCPNCLETIRWYDNIPLLSWILLRARCRHCRQPISWRYPLVELSFAAWVLFCVHHLLDSYDLRNHFQGMQAAHAPAAFLAMLDWNVTEAWIASCGYILLGFLLIGLMVMDWQTHTLPDVFTLSGTLLGFLLVCTEAIFLPTGMEDVHFNPQRRMRLNSPGSFAARGDVFLTGPEHLVLGRMAAILGTALIPLLIRALYRALRKREGMGLGDVKLMALIAALLGFAPALFSLFAGVLACAGYAAVLLLRRRADAATRLPLGSFLAGAGLLAAVVGDPLIAWYRSLL